MAMGTYENKKNKSWYHRFPLTLWTDISSTRHSSIDSSREWPEISILIRWERIDLTSSSSSPATSGKTWGQRQMETRGIREDDGGDGANESVHHSSMSSFNFYQSLLIPRGLRAWDGGLADGLADGLGLKLRTRCLSIPVFVPLPFQPVGLDFNIPLKMDEERKKVQERFRFGRHVQIFNDPRSWEQSQLWRGVKWQVADFQ